MGQKASHWGTYQIIDLPFTSYTLLSLCQVCCINISFKSQYCEERSRSQFCSESSWGSEKLNELPTVTESVWSRTKIQPLGLPSSITQDSIHRLRCAQEGVSSTFRIVPRHPSMRGEANAGEGSKPTAPRSSGSRCRQEHLKLVPQARERKVLAVKEPCLQQELARTFAREFQLISVSSNTKSKPSWGPSRKAL